MSIALFLLLQSATPYGTPAEEILLPRGPKPDEQQVEQPVGQQVSSTEKRFNDCVDLAIDNPVAAIAEANRWRIEGGRYLARHCLAFAYAEQARWPLATTTFVEAAREAEVAGDERTANFWAQAGNAALADGQALQAIEHFNAALVQGSLEGLQKGEVHLDRARAYVAQGNYEAAKADFVLVHQLVPQDPLGWLLSATLARRMGELQLATNDIAKAAELAGGDPEVALEAGNIAYEAGDVLNAKANWEKAVRISPESPPGKAAATYLSQLVTGVEE